MAHSNIPFAEPPRKPRQHRFSKLVHGVMIAALIVCGGALAITWMLR